MTLALPALQLRNPFARVAARLDATSEEAKIASERDAAYADIATFARHATIQDADGAEIRFADQGWAWQFQLLALWAASRLVAVLKARQLGVSWLAAIFALWFAIRRPGQTVLVISKGQDDARKFLEKIKFVYDRLPTWRPVAKASADVLKFPGIGSEIEVLPATENAGRSRTAQLVILDEWGHQPWARKIFLALKPAFEKGKGIGLSTANGHGALHSQVYLAAKAGRNGWKAVFIPASAHPDRKDPTWRPRARQELEQLSDADFAQEYPETDVEAIQTSGRSVFDAVTIARQRIRPGLTGEAGLVTYAKPLTGKIYVIGADVGEGLATSDWSSASVLERDEGDQVAQLRGRWAPDVFAAKLDRLARAYAVHANPALRQPVIVGVERNNHGHAVLLELRRLHGGTAPYAIYRAIDKRPGWLTNKATRPVLVDQLEQALRTGAVRIHDAGSVDQLNTFVYNDDGRPEAAEGYHDDDVVALAIAWQVRRRSFGRVLGIPDRGAAAA